MLHKAPTSRTYKWRLGIVGWAIFLYGFYFFYDGMVGYPAKNVEREHYAQLQETYGDDSQALGQAWTQFMIERGKWSAEREGTPPAADAPYTPQDIQTQFIFGFISCGIGGVVLFFWFSSLGKWIATDGQALISKKQHVPFEEMTDIDTSRWRNKGIAIVHYKSNGKEGSFIIDDWKFERKPADAIYKIVKEYLNPNETASQDSAAPRNPGNPAATASTAGPEAPSSAVQTEQSTTSIG